MFSLTEKENEDLQKWLKKHDKKCRFANPMMQGAIGGKLTYMFTPTSLGVITKVRCSCGNEKCISDFTDW